VKKKKEETTKSNSNNNNNSLNIDDLFGSNEIKKETQKEPQGTIVLSAEDGDGLEISTITRRVKGEIEYEIKLTNKTNSDTFSQFALKLNSNYFGLSPNPNVLEVGKINPKKSEKSTITLVTGSTPSDKVTTQIQVAFKIIKNDSEKVVKYFEDNIKLSNFFEETGKLSQENFVNIWKKVTDGASVSIIEGVKDYDNFDNIIEKLEKNNTFFIVKQEQNNFTKLFFTSQVKYQDTTISFISELLFSADSDRCKITSKAYPDISLLTLYENEISHILKN